MSLPWFKASAARVLANRDERIVDNRSASDLEAYAETVVMLLAGRLYPVGKSTHARSLGWSRGRLDRRLQSWADEVSEMHGVQMADTLAPPWWYSTEPVAERIVDEQRTANVQQTYSKRTDDGPHARSSLKREKETEREITPDTSTADAAEPAPGDFAGMAPRVQSALEAAGLTSWAAVAALTRSELSGRPGIGPKALEAIAAEMEAQGLSFRPANKPVKASKDGQRVKVATDAWAALWEHQRPGTRYPWSLGPGGKDRRVAAALAAQAGLDGQDGPTNRLKRSMLIYWEQVEAGDVWHSKVPTFSSFCRDADQWLQMADGYAAAKKVSPTTGKRKHSESMWGEAAEGVADRVGWCDDFDPAEEAKRLSAIEAANKENEVI